MMKYSSCSQQTAMLGGCALVCADGSWSKRPHSKTATPKTFCYQNGHNQNGHTAFGQNGHRGGITTKTATLHLVKTATKGGSLPKRPHCIWSKATEGCSLPKRPHYCKMATETDTLNMIPEGGRITTKTATLLQNGHRGRTTTKTTTLLQNSLNTSHCQKQPHYLPLASQ